MMDETEYVFRLEVSHATEVIRIDLDGRIFWQGREIETDDDFRAAMRDLAEAMKVIMANR